jgi:hypothetical protein
MTDQIKPHNSGRATAWIAVIERDGRKKRTIRLAVKFQSGNRIALDFAPGQARDIKQVMIAVVREYEALVAQEQAAKMEKPPTDEARASKNFPLSPASNVRSTALVRQTR